MEPQQSIPPCDAYVPSPQGKDDDNTLEYLPISIPLVQEYNIYDLELLTRTEARRGTQEPPA